MFNTCVSSWACKKTVVLVIVYHITCYCTLNIITLCLLFDCLLGGSLLGLYTLEGWGMNIQGWLLLKSVPQRNWDSFGAIKTRLKRGKQTHTYMTERQLVSLVLNK